MRSGTNDQDSSLIERIHNGDVNALRDVYIAYAAPLTGYIYSIVHDTAASEDLVHDIFIRIWERRLEWQPTHGIASYLYRAARNRALDYQDRIRVRSRAETSDANESISIASNNDIDNSNVQDLESRLRIALDSLPERRRIALTLRVMHDMSYTGIAATLGVTETAARILVNRAREELRGLLGSDIEG